PWLAHAALQGAVALLESRVSDAGRASSHRAAVSIAFFARAGKSRRRVRRPRRLYLLSGARARHDVGAAKRLRQFVVVADPVEDHGKPHLRIAAAVVAARVLRRLRAGRNGARHRCGAWRARRDGWIRATTFERRASAV